MGATPSSYTPGAPLSYALTVSNSGPSAATGTSIVDVFPAAYTGVTWTCSSVGGASCAASGSGNISQIVNLPSGSAVAFAISGTVAPGTTGTLSNTASATLGAGITDPQPSNNSATVNSAQLVQADVSASMSATPSEYTPGATLEYTLTVNTPDRWRLRARPSSTRSRPHTPGHWTCSATGGEAAPQTAAQYSQSVNLPVAAPSNSRSPARLRAPQHARNSARATVAAGITDPCRQQHCHREHHRGATRRRVGRDERHARRVHRRCDARLPADRQQRRSGGSTWHDDRRCFPAAYTGVTWSCSATGGASCPANGSGNISQIVNPVRGAVAFDISGTVAPAPPAP